MEVGLDGRLKLKSSLKESIRYKWYSPSIAGERFTTEKCKSLTPFSLSILQMAVARFPEMANLSQTCLRATVDFIQAITNSPLVKIFRLNNI